MGIALCWTFMTLAILFEVSGTTCLKLSDGFTRLLLRAAAHVCYIQLSDPSRRTPWRRRERPGSNARTIGRKPNPSLRKDLWVNS
jgi:hypothetical protein